MIDCSIIIPIEKDNISGFWFYSSVPPLVIALEPISTIRTKSIFRNNPTLDKSTFVSTPRNEAIKGNIAIIKHTDNGDTQIETPEEGATFEVYLKSSGSYEKANADERDVITCDENGYGATKNMPYGTYIVHQTSGWEGSELMKDFEVFISANGATYRYIINNARFLYLMHSLDYIPLWIALNLQE